MHNLPSIMSNAGWTVKMEPSAWPTHQHVTMHNSHTVICNAGWRVEMESSAWPSHQHATIHNSPTMISNAKWRVEMESSGWPSHQHATIQLTNYDFQCRMKSRDRVIMTIPPICYNTQLTDYNLQCRMKSGNGVISMATNMPQCTTHILWFPMQDGEWKWSHQHDNPINMPQYTTHSL